MGRSSKLVLQKFRDKPNFIDNLEQLSDGPIFLEGGAQLILDEHGEVVGAVGIRAAGFHVDPNQYEGDG